MVDVVYHKDGTPQCSQCNTGYEDAEGAEYCCTSCVDCGFRQHGMHDKAKECCPCDCDSDDCWCSEDGYCCQDYLADYGAESDDYSVYLKVWLDNDNYDSPLFGVFDTEKKAKAARWHDRNDNVRVFDIIKISRKGGKAVFGAEWHHSNTSCHECGSDDVDYTKVYYCSQCGEDDLVPGEQCSCDNIVSSKDYFEQMICGDCDNAWIEDDYSAEVMWDEDSWTQVKDNTIADIIADEYLDMGEDYDDADDYARRAVKKMAAETPGSTSYYIEEMVSIDDEDDFQTLFNLYLDLSDDIKDMESQGMQKSMRYLTAKRQQSQLSNRLDELQTEIKIMPEFEFDSEYLSRLSFRKSYAKPVAVLAAIGLAYFLGKKL